jgi:hypothetical protein
MGLVERMQDGGEDEPALNAGAQDSSHTWDHEERRRKPKLNIETPVEVEYTNPGDLLAMMVKSNADDSDLGMPANSDVSHPELREETRRKPIISIHGQDVDESDLDKAA